MVVDTAARECCPPPTSGAYLDRTSAGGGSAATCRSEGQSSTSSSGPGSCGGSITSHGCTSRPLAPITAWPRDNWPYRGPGGTPMQQTGRGNSTSHLAGIILGTARLSEGANTDCSMHSSKTFAGKSPSQVTVCLVQRSKGVVCRLQPGKVLQEAASAAVHT